MRGLSFNWNGPKAFILAVDGVFAAFDPENDQVWALNLASTHAYPFCLHTTFGLRARSMRLFPLIRINHEHYHDSSGFHCQPTVTRYTPDTLRVECHPIESLHTLFECFISGSDILVGSIRIKNLGKDPLNLILDLAAVLVPMGKGIPTRPEREGVNQIIVGQTNEIWPVLIMTGGPTAVNNPYPALSTPFHMKPGQSELLTWALAAKKSRSASLDAARSITAANWRKTSQAHVMAHASRTIQVQTGDAAWDAAFALSQTAAMTHYVLESSSIAHPFFLRTRLSDQPPIPSNKEDALDDLTALEANHLAQVLLPGRIELLAHIVEDLLNRRDEAGFLPSRLNTSGFIQPSRECPLLANLCLTLYEQNKDQDFLLRVFPALCQVTDSWLAAGGHSDKKDYHAWEDTQQLQLDTGLFAFDTWEETGKGLAFQYAESPALLAMLYRETMALSRTAEVLGQDSLHKLYSEEAQSLKTQLNRTWQGKWNRHAYLDGQSHLNPDRELDIQGQIKETLKVNQPFKAPQRLQLHLSTADEHTRACLITIEGKDLQGEPLKEQFRPRDVHWALRRAHLTTQSLYSAVDSITIRGMKPEDQFSLETADFSEADITCLLPVWSGAADREQIKSMMKTYLKPGKGTLSFGVPETWQTGIELPEGLPIRVNVLWNTLIIDGLLREGFIEEAAALFSKLMSTIVQGLRDFDGFYPYYDSKSGKPAGKRNAIAGLAPMQLFLKIAGIHLFSPIKVAILNHNPFQEKIEVCWQGLKIQREGIHTWISFPDGTGYEGDPEEPILISTEEM